MKCLRLIIIALLCAIVGPVSASPHGSAPYPFSGGVTQIGFNEIAFEGEFGFSNVLKTAQAWSWSDAAVGGPGPDMLDSNGYPLYQTTYQGNSCTNGICHGGIKTVLQIPTSGENGLAYYLITTGSCTIVTSGVGNTFAVSGTNTQTSFTASPNALGQISLSITVVPSSGQCSSIAIVNSNDLTAYSRGEIFGTKFLSRLRQAKFGVCRFLNWGGTISTNISNVARWADRKPQNYVFYYGYSYNSAYYAGNSTNGGDFSNDYSVTLGSGAPTDKQTIHVFWNATDTATAATVTVTNGTASIAWASHGLSIGDPVGLYAASDNPPPLPFTYFRTYYVVSVPDSNHVTLSATSGGAALTPTQSGTPFAIRVPTLNLNTSGAVPILNQSAQVLGSDGNNQNPGANRISTLTYDADLGSWLKFGGDTETFNNGIDNGVPIEVELQLAKEAGCHPWFVQPYLTAGPSAGAAYPDWLPQLATYVKAWNVLMAPAAG